MTRPAFASTAFACALLTSAVFASTVLTSTVFASAVLAVGLSCVGCAAPDAAPSRSVGVLPDRAGPLDALNRRHARLRQRMRLRGYGEEIGLTRSLVLEDRGVAFPLDLSTSKCSTFLALGGGSIRELTLTLYDALGDEAATESVNGEGGLVHVCPQAEPGVLRRPYYLVLRAGEGSGAVMLAHFRSEPGAGDGFGGIFEGVLAPRVPFREVEEHLASTRAALRARGFAPVGPPLLERVTEGSVVRLPVPLEVGRCYVASARSGEGLPDIDLFLFDGAGVEVARDLAADAEPSIEYCPEVSGRHTFEVRAFEGAGAVGVLVFAGPLTDIDAERATEPVDGIDDRAPDDPALALGVLAAPLLSRGFAPPLFVSRAAAIVPGEVRTHDVVIGPGCAIVLGTASHEGMDLDLYLADDTGREADRDTAVQSTARVRACRDQPSVMRIAVKGYGRDGAYALAVLRAPDTVLDLQSLRLEETTASYRHRGFEERSSLRASLEEGQRFRRIIALDPGRCVAVAAAGDGGVRDIELFLRVSSDEPVVSDTRLAPHAAVSRCAETREQLSIDLLMRRGSGSVAIQVLESPGPGASPSVSTPARTPPAGSPPATADGAGESDDDRPQSEAP